MNVWRHMAIVGAAAIGALWLASFYWESFFKPAPAEFLTIVPTSISAASGAEMLFVATERVRAKPQCRGNAAYLFTYEDGSSAADQSGSRVRHNGAVLIRTSVPELAPKGKAVFRMREFYLCGEIQAVETPPVEVLVR